MPRQVRSETTRQKILAAAVEVFSEVGYAAAAWSAIIERSGMTKGALYHHFDSKESLASAVLEEASALATFHTMSESPAPALENIIHGMFAVADLLASDKAARVAGQLTFALGEFSATATRVRADWVSEMSTAVRRAAAEGDVRPELDGDSVGEALVAAMFGTQLLNNAPAGADTTTRLSQMWELLLPALTTEASLPYMREFLRREALRHI